MMKQDTGYSWVVLFAAFMLNVHHAGGVGTIGVFLLAFTDHFDTPKSAATPIAGLLLCVGFLFGFPVGWLCRSYGPRPVALAAGVLTALSLILSACATSITILYFTYGCMASVAFCSLFTTGTIAIQHYFLRRRALANGVAIAGVSLGVIIWGPFSRWAIDMYGWRGALVLLAGVHLHSLVFALLLRPYNIHKGNEQDKSDVKTSAESSLSGCWKLVKNQLLGVTSPIREHPAFCGYLLGVLMVQAGHIIPYGLIPTRAKSMGIDQTLGATLVSVIGLASGCSRPLAGWIGDRKCVDVTFISGVSGVVAGVMTALSVLLSSYTQMMLYAASLGITSATYIALQGATVVNIVGTDKAAPGIGFLATAIGLGHLVSLAVSGKLLDMFPDPAYTFLVFGGLECAGGFVIILTMIFHKYCQKKVAQPQPDL